MLHPSVGRRVGLVLYFVLYLYCICIVFAGGECGVGGEKNQMGAISECTTHGVGHRGRRPQESFAPTPKTIGENQKNQKNLRNINLNTKKHR